MFANELQEAVIKNDIAKVSRIVTTLEVVPKDFNGSDPLEDATLLGHLDIVRILFGNMRLRKKFAINVAFEASIFTGNFAVTEYFIDQFIIDRQFEELNQLIKTNWLANRLTQTFVERYLLKLTADERLNQEEKCNLIALPLEYILKLGVYDSADEFNFVFDKIIPLIKSNNKLAAEIKKHITFMLAPLPNNNTYPKQQNVFLRKLRWNAYFSFANHFVPTLLNTFRQKALASKEPLAIFYFLNSGDLHYEDANKNNLAHLAALANSEYGIYYLYRANPALFTAKNADNMTPVELLPETASCKRLLEAEWQPYHQIRAVFYAPEMLDTHMIDSEAWGSLSKKHAVQLDQVKIALTRLKTEVLPRPVFVEIFAEISKQLFFVIEKEWPRKDYNFSSLAELLRDYMEFGKQHALICYLQLIPYTQVLFRLNQHQQALEIVDDMLQYEREVASPCYLAISIFQLVELGLHAYIVAKSSSCEYFYSGWELVKPEHGYRLLRTVIFSLITNDDLFANVPEALWAMFRNTIESMSVVVPPAEAILVTDIHIINDFNEACYLMAKWAERFFQFPDTEIDLQKKQAIVEIKLIFLEKTLALLQNFMSMAAKDNLKKGNEKKFETNIREQIDSAKDELDIIARRIVSATKTIKTSQLAVKPVEATVTVKAIEKIADTFVVTEQMKKPQEVADVVTATIEIVPAKPDLSIYKLKNIPAIFDDGQRVAPCTQVADKLSKQILLQPRFFNPKDDSYAVKRHTEALDLSHEATLRLYCVKVAKKNRLMGNYLNSLANGEEAINYFATAKYYENLSDNELTLDEIRQHYAQIAQLIIREMQQLKNMERWCCDQQQNAKNYLLMLTQQALSLAECKSMANNISELHEFDRQQIGNHNELFNAKQALDFYSTQLFSIRAGLRALSDSSFNLFAPDSGNKKPHQTDGVSVSTHMAKMI